jgi:hypothetical protein
MRLVMFIALGFLAFAGIVSMVVVTAMNNDPSPAMIWTCFAGTLTALGIVLILEFDPKRRR